MYEVGVTAQFEAAHRLKGEFGPAIRRHGHAYRVEVKLSGETLRDDGTLCDLGTVRRVVDGAVAELDYQDLDELSAFEGRNSTAEAVAQHLFASIVSELAESKVRSIEVRVWESPRAWAGYSAGVG
jgi:6-pyruvoyltetrahydropterin/6-carboxytetrahydropterin synthase